MLGGDVGRVHGRLRGPSCCTLGLSPLPAGLLSGPVRRNALCTLYVTRHLRHGLAQVPPQGLDLAPQLGDVARRPGPGGGPDRRLPVGLLVQRGQVGQLRRTGLARRDRLEAGYRDLTLAAQPLPGPRGGLPDRIVTAGTGRGPGIPVRGRLSGNRLGRLAGARSGAERLQEPFEPG